MSTTNAAKPTYSECRGLHGPRRERGAALIVSLILLLVMTLIGVASMRTTTLEERMAGNMRDQSLAFEGGEAGLREAENFLRTLSSPIDFGDDPPTPSGGLYHYNGDPPEDYLEDGDWQNIETNLGLSIDALSQQPKYVIEQLYFEPPPPDADEVGSLDPTEVSSEPDDQLFRVLVQAWGGSTSSDPSVPRVVLESRFRP